MFSASIKPNPLCSNWEFDCGDGICIRAEGRCDRYQNCQNGADEENCGMFLGLLIYFSDNFSP